MTEIVHTYSIGETVFLGTLTGLKPGDMRHYLVAWLDDKGEIIQKGVAYFYDGGDALRHANMRLLSRVLHNKPCRLIEADIEAVYVDEDGNPV